MSNLNPLSPSHANVYQHWHVFFAQPKWYGKAGSLLLIVFLLFAFFVVQLLSLFMALPFLPNDIANANLDMISKFLLASNHGSTLAVSVVFNAIFLISLCWLVIKIKGGQVARFLSLNLPSLRWVGFFVSAWILFVLVSEAVSIWLDVDALEFMRPLYDGAEPKWLFILAITVFAPVYEEVLFRGVIWSLIAKQFSKPVYGFWTASLVSSGLFALVHLQYDAYGMATIFILALLFSLARVKSASLWLPMLLHVCNNSLSMYVLIHG